MTSPAEQPTLNGDAFVCPSCHAYAQQEWFIVRLSPHPQAGSVVDGSLAVCKCTRCSQKSVWRGPEMVHPRTGLGPEAHPDMPSDVRAIYDEASEVSAISRKSAAALLRLALQVLVDDLEPGSANINTKIGTLVQRGLDPQVQQAMDVVRVVGNNAVHPGQIDLDADDGLLPALFGLVNLIVEQVVTRPKALAALYGSLPPGAQAAVARRDGTTS